MEASVSSVSPAFPLSPSSQRPSPFLTSFSSSSSSSSSLSLCAASDRLRWRDLSKKDLLGDLEEISRRASAFWEAARLADLECIDAASRAESNGQLDEEFAEDLARLAAEALRVVREKTEKARDDEREKEGCREEGDREKGEKTMVSAFFEINAKRKEIAEEAVALSLSVDFLRLSLLSAASSCLSAEKQAEAWREASVSTVDSGVCGLESSGDAPVAASQSLLEPSQAAQSRQSPPQFSSRRASVGLGEGRKLERDRERLAVHFRAVCTPGSDGGGEEATAAFERFWTESTCRGDFVDLLQKAEIERMRPSAAEDLLDFLHRLVHLPPICFREDEVDISSPSALPHLVQDAKDAQRDFFLINGSLLAGSDGFSRVVTRLHHVLCSDCKAASLDSILEALLILHLQSRTYTGGSSVDFLFPLLSLSPLCLLVPLPTQSLHNQLVTLFSHSRRQRLPSSHSSSSLLSSSASEQPVGVQLHAHTQYRFHVAAPERTGPEAAKDSGAGLSSASGKRHRGQRSSPLSFLWRSKKRASEDASSPRQNAPEQKGEEEKNTEEEKRFSKEFLQDMPARDLLENVRIDVHWFAWVDLEALRRSSLSKKIREFLRHQVAKSDKARSIWTSVALAFDLDAAELEREKEETENPFAKEDLPGERIVRQCIYLSHNAREVWENFLKEKAARKEKKAETQTETPPTQE
ncbi:hypothetical protein TGVAND_276100 [Toxoplasma gondii VAND]|uniref:Uncharacterized protein n=1 Tax=Toxoplasma gondii VAND TaxID=933077 RepID=A0A086Q142_TOXGO|nr:hypothetical protein TGVAND_276100 [Toxoplasma gondii VAND]